MIRYKYGVITKACVLPTSDEDGVWLAKELNLIGDQGKRVVTFQVVPLGETVVSLRIFTEDAYEA